MAMRRRGTWVRIDDNKDGTFDILYFGDSSIQSQQLSGVNRGDLYEMLHKITKIYADDGGAHCPCCGMSEAWICPDPEPADKG